MSHKPHHIDQWAAPDLLANESSGRPRDYETAKEKRHDEVIAALVMVARTLEQFADSTKMQLDAIRKAYLKS